MFGSAVLNVAIGLIFSFLALSLATGIIVETISSALKLRASTLQKGIGELLNDPQFNGLAKLLYSHAAVNPRGPGAQDPRKNRPAYIQGKQFANAILDITGMSAVAGNTGANPATWVQNMQAAVDTQLPAAANSQMNQLLTGIINRAAGDIDKIQGEIAAWFDNGMDRVSGVYKRWSQWISVLAALALAVVLNIDTLRIGQTLWENPTLANELQVGKDETVESAVAKMEKFLPVGWPQGIFKRTTPAIQVIDKTSSLPATGTTAPSQIAAAGSEKTGKVDPYAFTWDDWFRSIAGWGLAAFATLFGAPFWYDSLQQIVRLKGTGEAPADKPRT